MAESFGTGFTAAGYGYLDALQGRGRTYYVGGLPAFELVECAVAHAQDLARRYFPAVDGGATVQEDRPVTIEEEQQA
jgi:hypothetical protein